MVKKKKACNLSSTATLVKIELLQNVPMKHATVKCANEQNCGEPLCTSCNVRDV